MTNIGTIEIQDLFVGSNNAVGLYLGAAKVWGKSEPPPPPPATPWLCFTAETANSTVRLDKAGSPNAISLETSTDGTTWTDYGWTGSSGDTLTLTNIGDKVYMRAKTENSIIASASPYYKFVGTGSFGASGNIQSLLKADCSRTDVPENCYRNMFNGCTSLTTAPSLPATTLASYCYSNMFFNCTSLTSAPTLPATTLADACYALMFYGCSNLNSITLGYTGNFASAPTNAFSNWVSGVASKGTFYYNGSDTTRGASAIPNNWTITPFS